MMNRKQHKERFHCVKEIFQLNLSLMDQKQQWQYQNIAYHFEAVSRNDLMVHGDTGVLDPTLQIIPEDLNLFSST